MLFEMELNSKDDIDGNVLGTTRRDVEEPVAMNSSQQLMPNRYTYEYNMCHRNRGMAIIFNHEIFDDKTLDTRSGTNNDSDNLCETLADLQFVVKVCKDYRIKEIQNEIKFLSKYDHTDNDCLVIVILSHGSFGTINAKDGPYEFDSIWKELTETNCPTLAGKPKLFFIQACQGQQMDSGLLLRSRLETDSNFNLLPFSYMIPSQIYPDFLIAYSTIPGYYSWRNPKNGSWFITSLCNELKKNGLTLDILTLLTFVMQTVAYDYESYVPSVLLMDKRKQIPCVTTMLTRRLRFKEK